jgi:peptidoglycan/LPS O-acetylase OafA/YrhL
MRWLGERSYSIYLWNILARAAIFNSIGRTVVGDIAWIAMTVVLAGVSYRLVERPLRAKLARKSGASTRPMFGLEGAGVPRVV